MRRALTILSLCLLVAAEASAQVREARVVFKDGFSVKGKVIQKRDYLVDPVTGQSVLIAKDGSFLHLDDDVRRIHFPPFQVQEVIESKQGETRKDLITIHKQDPIRTRKDYILPGWSFEKFTAWNEKWERTITVKTPTGVLEMQQRIIHMTPWHTYIMNTRYLADQQFLTKELGPEFVLDLLAKYYGAKKDMSEQDKRLQMARFAQQAGWYGVALTEAEKLVKEYPEAKEAAQPLIDQLKKLRAKLFVEDIERTQRIGQHEECQARIAAFDQEYLSKLASEKEQILVQELRTKYDSSRSKLQQAKQFLKELPTKVNAADRPFWTVAAGTIADELTIDTLPRLDTFLTYAQQYAKAAAGNANAAQTPEQVLSIAVSGWLQGNILAEPDVKNATRLFKARLMLQEYLKTEAVVARSKLADSFTKEHEMSADDMARVIRHMPPALAFDKPSVKQISLSIELPDAVEAGSYLVQLPPDYNHNRPYPVVMLLQSPREPAAILIERWKEAAAQHGYVLAAPLWVTKSGKYNYSAREHHLVLDSLRDLRRRFNVDSDRVFLFGWETGGTMAFDVGLSHPDQFAGVLPMNGSCATFPSKYWSNGQYLPFYVVEGENNGNNAVASRTLFKDWIRGNYPSLYVEYKGRASEWFGWELPTMFEWMNKKKRHHPAKELGRAHTAGGSGEEFKTMREFDNRYYWLSTSSIDDRNLNDPANFEKLKRPATLQGYIAVGNEADAKGARIWSQINVRTVGIKQVSVWLAPHMIDFTKPVAIRVNGVQHGASKVIAPSLATMLEEFYQSGDRQRLFYAKIDLKL